MVSDDRDGLARAIRDAYATDCGLPTTESAWSDLVGTVEEWYPEADAALAYLAARPAVDVEAVARVLRDHRRTTTTPLPDVTYYDCCTCGWVDLTGPDHAHHVAEQIAALTPDATR